MYVQKKSANASAPQFSRTVYVDNILDFPFRFAAPNKYVRLVSDESRHALIFEIKYKEGVYATHLDPYYKVYSIQKANLKNTSFEPKRLNKILIKLCVIHPQEDKVWNARGNTPGSSFKNKYTITKEEFIKEINIQNRMGLASFEDMYSNITPFVINGSIYSGSSKTMRLINLIQHLSREIQKVTPRITMTREEIERFIEQYGKAKEILEKTKKTLEILESYLTNNSDAHLGVIAMEYIGESETLSEIFESSTLTQQLSYKNYARFLLIYTMLQGYAHMDPHFGNFLFVRGDTSDFTLDTPPLIDGKMYIIDWGRVEPLDKLFYKNMIEYSKCVFERLFLHNVGETPERYRTSFHDFAEDAFENFCRGFFQYCLQYNQKKLIEYYGRPKIHPNFKWILDDYTDADTLELMLIFKNYYYGYEKNKFKAEEFKTKMKNTRLANLPVNLGKPDIQNVFIMDLTLAKPLSRQDEEEPNRQICKEMRLKFKIAYYGKTREEIEQEENEANFIFRFHLTPDKFEKIKSTLESYKHVSLSIETAFKMYSYSPEIYNKSTGKMLLFYNFVTKTLKNDPYFGGRIGTEVWQLEGKYLWPILNLNYDVFNFQKLTDLTLHQQQLNYNNLMSYYLELLVAFERTPEADTRFDTAMSEKNQLKERFLLCQFNFGALSTILSLINGSPLKRNLQTNSNLIKSLIFEHCNMFDLFEIEYRFDFWYSRANEIKNLSTLRARKISFLLEAKSLFKKITYLMTEHRKRKEDLMKPILAEFDKGFSEVERILTRLETRKSTDSDNITKLFENYRKALNDIYLTYNKLDSLYHAVWMGMLSLENKIKLGVSGYPTFDKFIRENWIKSLDAEMYLHLMYIQTIPLAEVEKEIYNIPFAVFRGSFLNHDRPTMRGIFKDIRKNYPIAFQLLRKVTFVFSDVANNASSTSSSSSSASSTSASSRNSILSSFADAPEELTDPQMDALVKKFSEMKFPGWAGGRRKTRRMNKKRRDLNTRRRR